MAIHLQNYSPDTCTCVVQESWDDSVPSDQRVHTLQSVIRRGVEHAAVVDASLLGVIYEENFRKNKAFNEAVIRTGKVPDEVVWEFTPGRLLQISFLGATVSASVKANLQVWCDTNLGVARVLVL